MNNNNEKVIDMTNENENNELNELRESNANLIAEREALMGEVEQLKKKFETERADKIIMWESWQKEEKKVQFLLALLDSGINSTEYMKASEFVKKLIKTM